MSIQHPSLNDPNVWVPYRYYPSVAAAAVFVFLFASATFAHCLLLFSRRTWFFVPFIVGGCFELAGYVGRIVSAGNIWALGPYIVQSLLVLVAPALFAASIYIILSRIILVVDGERCALILRRWLTKLFVTGDVIAFFLQLTGGGIQAAGTPELFNIGEKVIIAGLFAQVVFFGFFIVVAISFQQRFNRSVHDAALTPPRIWKRHMYAVYTGATLIMARSIFRIVEYLMGNDGFLLAHEYFQYIFDAVPMFLVIVLFLAIHPSQLVASRQEK